MSAPTLPFTAGTRGWEQVGWVQLAYPPEGPVPQGEPLQEPVAAFRALGRELALFVGCLPEGAAVDVVLRGHALPPRAIPLPIDMLGTSLQLLLIVCPAPNPVATADTMPRKEIP